MGEESPLVELPSETVVGPDDVVIIALKSRISISEVGMMRAAMLAVAPHLDGRVLFVSDVAGIAVVPPAQPATRPGRFIVASADHDLHDTREGAEAVARQFNDLYGDGIWRVEQLVEHLPPVLDDVVQRAPEDLTE